MRKIIVNLKEKSYPIYLKRGILYQLKDYISLNRKVLIISDQGVPQKWIDVVLKQCPNVECFIVPQGECSKSFEWYEKGLRLMLKKQFSRNDLVLALGGGVVGDLAGFIASSYKRGIDFCQIPTTTLSQIDSSIGGKVAINVDKIKNCVGAFYQPQAVFVDADTLTTLDNRHFNNGIVEAIKAACLGDMKLLELIEEDLMTNIEEILYRSILFKKNIVEQDEKELHIRKILNFGHTLGHGFESAYQLSQLYHGEAVAMGMLRVVKNEKIKQRLMKLFDTLSLPSYHDYDIEEVFEYILLDKKGSQEGVDMIIIEELLKPQIINYVWNDVKKLLEEV